MSVHDGAEDYTGVMTLNEFITVHNHRRISGWSQSGGQCVDQVRKYMQEVLGVHGNTFDWITPGNAHDFFHNANATHFRKVRNSPTGIPPAGSIVVLNHGEYGHVFVARAGSTVHKILSFDQNWSIQRICAEEAHNYAECIGWLIKR